MQGSKFFATFVDLLGAGALILCMSLLLPVGLANYVFGTAVGPISMSLVGAIILAVRYRTRSIASMRAHKVTDSSVRRAA